MLYSTALIILAGALVTAKGSDPTSTPWPMEFVIKFETNITTNVDFPIIPVQGVSFYDWAIKAQRIEHGAGAYECTHFYNSDSSCTLFFLSDGMYRVISAPFPEGQEECCLDLPGIGPSPPDWTSITNPTYNGVYTDAYSSFDARKWTFDAFSDDLDNCHEYQEVSPDDKTYAGRPLIFTFPDANGLQDYHYDPKSMYTGPIKDTIFSLPVGCAGKLCETSTQSMRSQN